MDNPTSLEDQVSYILANEFIERSIGANFHALQEEGDEVLAHCCSSLVDPIAELVSMVGEIY
jgi:hypothetical protein